jgi:hypothetical protein
MGQISDSTDHSVAGANPESAAVLGEYGTVTTYDSEGRRTGGEPTRSSASC